MTAPTATATEASPAVASASDCAPAEWSAPADAGASAPRLLWAVISLEAGPSQFNILGFIAAIAAAPVARSRLVAGGARRELDPVPGQPRVAGRRAPIAVERPFRLLAWQLLVVHGLVLGWHRQPIVAALRAARPSAAKIVVTVAVLATAVVLLGPVVAGAAEWARWESDHSTEPRPTSHAS